MQRWAETFHDDRGKPLIGASVSVYVSGTLTPATIYEPDENDIPASAKPNPFTTNALGFAAFAVADGTYDITIQGSGAVYAYRRVTINSGGSGGGSSVWGGITGTLSDQTDLQAALDAKQDAGSYQPLDGDLTAIAGLVGASGLPRKTAPDTWTLDTSTYLTGTKVDSFNTRTGAVTLTSGDVTGALTFTPYNSTNPAGYISGNQTITISGDAIGSGATAITVAINTFSGSAKGLVPASAGGTTNFLRADGSWAAPSGGSGGTVANGTGVIDFGAFPGSNEASLVITGQTSIISTSKPSSFVRVEATSDHTADDHTYAAHLVSLSCGNIVAGTGFTVYARSEQKMQGTFNIDWIWV